MNQVIGWHRGFIRPPGSSALSIQGSHFPAKHCRSRDISPFPIAPEPLVDTPTHRVAVEAAELRNMDQYVRNDRAEVHRSRPPPFTPSVPSLRCGLLLILFHAASKSISDDNRRGSEYSQPLPYLNMPMNYQLSARMV